MYKFTSLLFSIFILSFFSFAQSDSELTDEQRAYIEEFGTSIPTVLLNEEKIFIDDPSLEVSESILLSTSPSAEITDPWLAWMSFKFL